MSYIMNDKFGCGDHHAANNGGPIYSRTLLRAKGTLNLNLKYARAFSIVDRRDLLSSNQFDVATSTSLTGQLSASESKVSIASTFADSTTPLLRRKLHGDDVSLRDVYLFAAPELISPFEDLVMDNINVAELIDCMGSDEDAVRKMAVFRLQSNVGDPSFSDTFISDGGLTKLKYLILRASGNTLAYSLASFSRLLEVDKGWECVEQDMIRKVHKYQTNFNERC